MDLSVRYPYERFLVWAMAHRWDDRRIVRQAAQYSFFYDESTFLDLLGSLRQQVAQQGGKALRKRWDADKDPTPRQIERLDGNGSLSHDETRGRLETVLAVPPLRRAIQILACAGLTADRCAEERQVRYGMDLSPPIIAAYWHYFWNVGPAGYADLYTYLQLWPDSEDKEFFLSCLGRDLRYIYWRLGFEGVGTAQEGEALEIFMAGAQQHLVNAVRPENNPKGTAPVAWLQSLGLAREMYYDWLERNRHQASDTFVDHIRKQIVLKKTESKALPQIGTGELEDVA